VHANNVYCDLDCSLSYISPGGSFCMWWGSYKPHQSSQGIHASTTCVHELWSREFSSCV